MTVATHNHDAAIAAFGLCPTCATQDGAEGKARRDDAIDAVEEAAPADWMLAARQVVMVLAALDTEFSTDDLWARLPPTAEPRAMGAVIRWAQQTGLIRGLGRYTPSKRPECHSRPIPLWRGV